MFQSLESKILSNINPILLKKKKKHFNILYNLRKNWPKIIGDKYCDFTYVKDIKISKDAVRTLKLEMYNPTISFLLSAEIDNIIENITIYYGYKIIDDIKLIQKPSNISLKKNKKIEDNLELTSNLESQIGNIKDTELKDILIKLGKEIITKKK